MSAPTLFKSIHNLKSDTRKGSRVREKVTPVSPSAFEALNCRLVLPVSRTRTVIGATGEKYLMGFDDPLHMSLRGSQV